jgi:hypothetical protein
VGDGGRLHEVELKVCGGICLPGFDHHIITCLEPEGLTRVKQVIARNTGQGDPGLAFGDGQFAALARTQPHRARRWQRE